PKALALTDRPHPKDNLQARVSLYHWAAVALIRGTARIADMDTESAVLEPGIVRFQEKIETISDDTVAADGAEVTLKMRDGRSLVSRIEHAIGSASRPMTDLDLEQKFTGLTEP